MTARVLEPAPQRVQQPERRRLRLLFVGLMVGLLLSELDQTIFATALPTIVGDLGGVDGMLWVTTAYALAGTVVMPLYGVLGDLIGRKSLFVAALSIFVLGSVLGGVAPDLGWLVVGRAVQGIGGGGLLILIQAIVADLLPARERAPYLSVIDAVFALSAVLGPFLGGWFAEGLGWRWALWINVPLGLVAIALAAVLLPPRDRQPEPVQVDVRGFAALTVAVTGIILLASWGGTHYPWASPVILAVGGVTLVATLVFVAAERRAVNPIIPLELFRRRNFTVATLGGLVMAVAMFGALGYLPTYLQMVSGLSARDSGLLMLSLIAGVMTTTLVSARIVSRTGRYRRLPVIGTGVVAVALGLLSTLEPDAGLPLIGGYLFLLGAGIGCALEILVIIVQNTVPNARVGVATATTSFFREIGVSLGSAVVGTLFTTRLTVLLAQGPAATAGLDVNSLIPAQVNALPADVRGPIAAAYHEALTPVFLYLVPLMLLSMVALWFLQPAPLSTTVAGADAETDPDVPPGAGPAAPDRDTGVASGASSARGGEGVR